MRLNGYILFILLFGCLSVNGQTSPDELTIRKVQKLNATPKAPSDFSGRMEPEQDCNSAIPVCSGTFNQPNAYSGIGNEQEVPFSSCLGSQELNSVWYIFTVQSNGTLEFTIDPNDPDDDYDFALYDLTGRSCSDIPTGAAPEVRCNYCVDSGPTGISSAGSNPSEDCCSNSPGCRFSSLLNVTTGETFALVVSNFTASNSGYTLDFGGTADIFDNSPPEPASVITPCGVNFIDVQMSEGILCSSISPNGSEFTLTGPGGPFTITGATGMGCGTSTAQLRIDISPQVMIGSNYTLTVNSGVDGNTVIDNCGNSLTAGTTLNFEAIPNEAEISGPRRVCSGSEITLSASAGTNYMWSNGETTQSITVSPTTQTTYDVTVSSGTCVQNASTTVNVDPAPIADFTFSPGQICTGETVSFSNNSTLLTSCLGLGITSCTPGSNDCGILPCLDNTTLTAWEFGDGDVSLQENPNHTYNTAGTFNITLTLTDVFGGCTNKVTFPITVLPQSGQLNVMGDNSICSGETATLSALGASSVAWSSNPSGFSSSSLIVEVTPTVNTTYIATSPGCNGNLTATIDVVVNDLPTVGVNPAAPTACPGNPVVLSANGASTYDWSPSTGLSTTMGSTVSAEPTQTTTYTVIGTDANGCQNSETVTVTVDSPIALNVTPDGPTTICMGNVINVNLDAGSGYMDYDWSTGETTQTINVQMAGTYTVTVTNAAGCTATENITVSEVADIDAAIGPDVSICEQTEITLMANGGDTYVWSPTDGLSDPTIANPIASPLVTTEYVVIATQGTCTDQDTIVVTVLPAPVATTSGSVNIELGESVSLEADGGMTYAWSPGSSLSDSTISNPIATPETTTTYVVTVTDSEGCSIEETVTITVGDVDNCNLESVFIPTAFSPNNDGLNDTYFIQLDGGYDELDLWIFDRWGQMVFHTTDISNGWNGSANGKAQSTDAYGYNLEIKCGEKSLQKSGSITIMR